MNRIQWIIFGFIWIGSVGSSAYAKVNAVEVTQKTAENQVRHLLEPVLDKYCHDSCKLLSIGVTVDVATADEVAPGFDDVEAKKGNDLAASSARAKILIDDKVGPVSRGKLLELLQQYLDTLDYPVKIDTQIAHFPLPQGSESRIAELRDRVSKQFISTTEGLLAEFCPRHCILADYDLQTDVVNGEEAQYGAPGEFIQDGDAAIRIKDISATLLMDESLTKEEQSNIVEMAKLKTNSFRHVTFNQKVLKFPHPIAMSAGRALAGSGGQEGGVDSENKNSSSTANNKTAENNTTNNSNTHNLNSNSSDVKQEKFERTEKIERVESGDAVQAELQKFKVFGLIFSCSALALLIFIAMSRFRSADDGGGKVHRIIQSLGADPVSNSGSVLKSSEAPATKEEKAHRLSKRYEIELLTEELTAIYAQQPKVAKQVFSRILTEEGVETTAECIHVFGEAIVVDMLRDPSLQSDLTELMDFYTKNPVDLNDEEKLDLLRKLHNRTVVGKLVVLGNRSSNLFDFLSEMDGQQILELVRTESLTVKSIVLTQCDPQKRSVLYSQMEPEIRMQLLAELSRIDYLPKDYIFNVASALKRKKKENPKLNTEALPGSEVLVSLLERTGQAMQKTVVKALEVTNPESARTVKGKLVSMDTLRYLRDGQLLEVVLSLNHEELIQFLKGVPNEVRTAIFTKSPKDLVAELEEELVQAMAVSREVYQAVERKILNRMKIMANEGQINLVETNERMFSDHQPENPFVETTPGTSTSNTNTDGKTNGIGFKKVAGW